jgi:hypothetical protein
MRDDVTFRATIATDVDVDPPSLSGDGSLVAYAKKGQIHVAHTDGSGEPTATNLQESAAHDPAISEDGKVVVFRIGPKSSRRLLAFGSGLTPRRGLGIAG